jgi:hypothetical protein
MKVPWESTIVEWGHDGERTALTRSCVCSQQSHMVSVVDAFSIFSTVNTELDSKFVLSLKYIIY